MAIRAREIGGIHILDLEDRIDINSSDIIETVGWFTSTGKLNIILNLQGVNVVDYSGVSVLAITYKNVVNHKGKIKFVNVPPVAIELLKVAKLDSVFEIYADEKTAINSFSTEETEEHHLRRKFTRLDMHLSVKYSLASSHKKPEVFEGQVLNISAAGLYVYAKHVLPINSQLHLELCLPDKPSALEASGRVSWLADKDIQPHSYPGMGVAFVHLDSKKERNIVDFIEKNVTHRAEPT